MSSSACAPSVGANVAGESVEGSCCSRLRCLLRTGRLLELDELRLVTRVGMRLAMRSAGTFVVFWGNKSHVLAVVGYVRAFQVGWRGRGLAAKVLRKRLPT